MGRPIGDNIGVYEYVTMIGLELCTDTDLSGWGFCLFVTQGRFSKPLPWLETTPGLNELGHQFDKKWWPLLHKKNVIDVKQDCQGGSVFMGQNWFAGAIQMALWDLLGKQETLPVYKLLDADVRRDRVRAYGSGLCFHLSEQETVAIYRRFVDMGITTVKVKVGHPDPKQDIRRLKLVRETVGKDIDISVDANLAWTARETIERVARYRDAGVNIIYVEDPMPANDIEGYRALASANVIDIAAHDYITEHAELEELLRADVIDYVRCTFDLDNIIARDKLARKYGKPSIISNAPFEIGIHAGVVSSNVELIEFSGLAWNDLPINPVRIEEGYMLVPQQPGHGFEPKPEVLAAWRQDESD